MAGPCFALVYQSFGPDEWTAFTRWASSVAGGQAVMRPQSLSFSLDASAFPRMSHPKDEPHAKRTCEYVASVRDAPFDAKTDRAAIEKRLGYVPARQLSVCAMCRGLFDLDGLMHIQAGIIERFGGWFAFVGDKLPPEAASLARGVVTVQVADHEGYFGSGPVDPSYAAQYEAFVQKKTITFIDAKLTGLRHVDV